MKEGRRHRPFQDRPGRGEGWASHPMPLVTCDYACWLGGQQETFDSEAGSAVPEIVPSVWIGGMTRTSVSELVRARPGSYVGLLLSAWIPARARSPDWPGR